ncbi:sister chromatid cohesion protein PDS5 [Microcoleus sp. FACHB-672]|uniref:sister chromatid cohesion protein PDS5 n=1 Tax=Microcoleus sp. FACHB-672 TaxID=2692825 RepID=UPI001685F3BA|nr:sister chromatid cohesion protein PDS5 [Microcoleus sp. FACHB-672]MBD2041576.1 HEAT repeat domain-containing protein [Microcoleus sp. FACHB-672]
MVKQSQHKLFKAAKVAILCVTLPLLALSNIWAQELNELDIDVQLQQLKDEDETNDQSAIDTLVKIGPEAIPDLSATLKNSSEAAVRAGAAKALGRIASEANVETSTIIPPLVEALKDSEPDIRRVAAEALGRMGEPAVPELIAALKGDSSSVRLVAAEALGQIGPDARLAVPALIDRLEDGDWRVRSGAARALGKIGTEAKLEATAIVPPLIQALKDSDPDVRRSAAEALGRIGSPVVPDLSRALQDENVAVRTAAAEALGQIGADAKEAVPNLIEKLQDGDWRVRSSVARSLGRIGSEAKLEAQSILPPLIATLKDKDPEVRRAAAEVLVKIGPEAVPGLITALTDEQPAVRTGVAWALGQMGSDAERAVPALISSLNDKNDAVRSAAAEALGRIGADAQTAISPLTEALQDPNRLVRGSAAEATRRIAGSLQDRADDLHLQQLKSALSDLTQARSALEDRKLELLNDPLLFKFTKEEIVVAISRSIKALETEKETRFFALSAAWILQRKWVLLPAIYAITLPLIWLLILWLRPLWLLGVNEALKPYKLTLSKHRGLTISARHLLFLALFDYHPRVLDAWVAAHIHSARGRFAQLATVSDRQVHIPVPVILDGNTFANLTGKELRPVFAQNQVRLLIWGEAGAGKTSLACQLAQWAMSDNPDERLCDHLQMPVLIEQELDSIAENSQFSNIINWRLQSVIGTRELISEELVKRLAQAKRLLVIVDHFSEMSDATRAEVRPAHPDFLPNALIVTSRIEETLDGVFKTTIKPLRVEGNRLSSFMEAYLTQRGARDRLSDLEFFDACSLLSLIVGQRNITVLLAKLYAEQLITYKEGTSTAGLADNIPDLMISYLNELNRAVTQNRFDDSLVHHDAKIVAWECLKQTFKPAAVSRHAALAALGGKQAETRIEYLEKRMRLIQTIDAGQDKIRFSLDPLAEYLAGLHLVDLYGNNTQHWRAFFKQVDTMPGSPQGCQGFLLAVRDCCLAKSKEEEIPSFVVEEIGKRAG